MKNSSRAGAAALITAGMLVIGSSPALAASPAKAERITSAESLRHNILQAVALERQVDRAEVSACTGGRQPR